MRMLLLERTTQTRKRLMPHGCMRLSSYKINGSQVKHGVASCNRSQQTQILRSTFPCGDFMRQLLSNGCCRRFRGNMLFIVSSGQHNVPDPAMLAGLSVCLAIPRKDDSILTKDVVRSGKSPFREHHLIQTFTVATVAGALTCSESATEDRNSASSA